MLLRLTDDFLFISTHQDAAVRFGRVLHAGIPEFGCVVNPRKSVANFSLRIPCPVGGVDDSDKELAIASDGVVPWCGLLLDTRSGEVFANFSRHERGSLCFILSH